MQVVTCVVKHVVTYNVTRVMTALLGQVVKDVMAKAGMQDHSNLIVGDLLMAASITDEAFAVRVHWTVVLQLLQHVTAMAMMPINSCIFYTHLDKCQFHPGYLKVDGLVIKETDKVT